MIIEAKTKQNAQGLLATGHAWASCSSDMADGSIGGVKLRFETSVGHNVVEVQFRKR